MLRQWGLKNFKAFGDHAPVTLSSINVLAGANSSGKSTVIQSILLLKQTLQYGSENRALALNGPLLRLGGFEDVRNFDCGSGQVEFSLIVDVDKFDTPISGSNPWTRSLWRHAHSLGADQVEAITLNLAFTHKAGADQRPGFASLNPDLVTTDLQVYRSTARPSGSLRFAKYVRREADESEDNEVAFSLSFPFKVDLDSDSEKNVLGDRPKAEVTSGSTSYFLPSWMTVKFDSAARDAAQLVHAVFNSSEMLIDNVELEGDEVLAPEILPRINEWLVGHDALAIELDPNGTSAEVVRSALLPFLRTPRNALSGLLGDVARSDDKLMSEVAQLKEEVLAWYLANTVPSSSVEIESPKGVTPTVEYLKEFFKLGIRYLGPLRDSPRPVYQLEALESTTDVGYRGEHTAAVLDLNKTRHVTYYAPPSDNLSEDYALKAKRRRASLHDAVVSWLVYLGVANEVETMDAGVYGNRLQVSTDPEGQLHDLTNVGVGVSQVLPIVVMSLLAAPGSLLILEQPELHLHPKVQARLADFFLSLALQNKQTLLETHSEYLIDRLRLRIALSDSDKVKSLVNILFSEKKGKTSVLVPVEISEYGAITNWPRDFFEQSQHEIGNIIKAASEKRKIKSKSIK